MCPLPDLGSRELMASAISSAFPAAAQVIRQQVRVVISLHRRQFSMCFFLRSVVLCWVEHCPASLTGCCWHVGFTLCHTDRPFLGTSGIDPSFAILFSFNRDVNSLQFLLPVKILVTGGKTRQNKAKYSQMPVCLRDRIYHSL